MRTDFSLFKVLIIVRKDHNTKEKNFFFNLKSLNMKSSISNKRISVGSFRDVYFFRSSFLQNYFTYRQV